MGNKLDAVPAELDFPNTTSALSVRDVAEKLGCDYNHIINLIEDGTLGALDIRGRGAQRACYRVPVECYRKFVAGRFR